MAHILFQVKGVFTGDLKPMLQVVRELFHLNGIRISFWVEIEKHQELKKVILGRRTAEICLSMIMYLKVKAKK